MWYNAGIENNQRAFIHCHNVCTLILLRSTARVCVTLTELPFPPLSSSNQTDKELKVRVRI